MTRKTAFAPIRLNHFTLFEMLISIGLLVILSVVLLRIFALTSDFWRISDEQSRIHADAKAVLSIIGEDVSSIVYFHSNKLAKELKAPIATSGNSFCFVAHSRWGSTSNTGSDKPGDIGKVRYYWESSTRRLYRGFLGDRVVSESDGNYKEGKMFAADKDMSTFFTTGDNPEIIAENVWFFDVKCYDEDWNVLSTDSLEGYKAVKAIHVTFSMLPENRVKEYNDISDDIEKKAFLFKHLRTFRKTFWIEPLAEY